MSETDIMNQIRAALSPYCIVHRVNVGLCYTKDGRPIRTGVAKGYSDLSGHRIADGKAFYIEVKTNDGKPSDNQKKFLKRMHETNAISGVCRSVEDALRLIGVMPNASE